MHVRRNHNIALPVSRRSPLRQHLSVMIDTAYWLAAGRSTSGNRSAGTSASVTNVRWVSAARQLGVRREFVRRFQQHAAALQQHSPHVGEFC